MTGDNEGGDRVTNLAANVASNPEPVPMSRTMGTGAISRDELGVDFFGLHHRCKKRGDEKLWRGWVPGYLKKIIWETLPSLIFVNSILNILIKSKIVQR